VICFIPDLVLLSRLERKIEVCIVQLLMSLNRFSVMLAYLSSSPVLNVRF